MRKRIAVFANGWGNEYLREVVMGAYEVAKENNIDLFSFVNFSRATDSFTHNLGEFNIFKLPDPDDFDGVILLVNSFNMKEEEAYVTQKLGKSKTPVISVEYNLDGTLSVNSDNYFGMHELAEHIIKVHGARDIVYIGGPKDHLESIERLAALSDAAKENGFAISDDNVLYGDWAKASAIDALSTWHLSHEKMPDAIVCANDVMAMGAVDFCKSHGYRVPKDVIVTGYDCTELAQNYEPSITSVSHEWVNMGKKTMEALLMQMDGDTSIAPIVMNTRFVCGESCGCKKGNQKNFVKMGRNPYYKKIELIDYDSHYRHMYINFRKADDAVSLHESLKLLFETENWMEGKNFTICLVPEYFSIVTDDQNLLMEGYSERMDIIFSLRDGVARPYEKLLHKEALFRMQAEQEKPQVYIVVPLSNEDKIYGFAILCRDMDIVLDNALYSWTRHMCQYLEQVRSNITITQLTGQLRKLSVTDALTGVYNRAGCEKIAYPMIRQHLDEGTSCVVLIADIDQMKAINDVYGHASGDFAVMTVADTLKKSVPSDWIISRCGGDEFFIGGCMDETFNVEHLIQSIMDALEKNIEEKKIHFPLSISIGYSIATPDGSHDVEEQYKEADRVMYYMKNEHKKRREQGSCANKNS